MPETLQDVEREIEELKKDIKAIKDIPEGQRTANQEALLVSYNQQLGSRLEDRRELRLIEGAAPAAAPAGVKRGIVSRWWDYWFGSVEPDLDDEIEKVLDCTVIIKASNGARGNGIIVTRSKLLTSLHGYFKKNDPFEVIDRHGVSRSGFVLATWYTESTVDIAVIELNPNSTPFDCFVPISTVPVKLGNDLCVISRRVVGGTDSYTKCFERSTVNAVIEDTSIFHSTYYAEAGMSGCGVVTVRSGKSFALVGVHVASHDKTTAVEVKTDGPPAKKKRKKDSGVSSPVTREEFDNAMMTVNSNIHGHGAYCLICEVARVEGLLDLLN